jgi:isocitrate/isopropylmalate dehydrogenase
MLDHLGLTALGDRIRGAVRVAVREKKTTKDLGGTFGTREAGDWLVEYVLTHP